MNVELEIATCRLEFSQSGEMNWVALPNYLLIPMLDVMVGLILTRLFKHRRLLLWRPVAVLSISVWLSLTCQSLVK